VAQWFWKMYSKEFYIAGFTRWLQTMHYDPSSIKNGPKRVLEFLEYLEQQAIKSVAQVKSEHVQAFFKVLSERKSKRTGEVLSIATLRNYQTTINRFARYLREMHLGHIEISVTIKSQSKKSITILTQSEITKMYDACEDGLLGIRDRALLHLYYGCGLRRAEGLDVRVQDILPDKSLLYIRQGKGYTERYVPLIGKTQKGLLYYLEMARPMMIGKKVHDYLIVGITGNPLVGNSIYNRIKQLIRKAGIKKQVGVHSLRHSIATHLLEQGMPLSEIAKFLGHKSLESTQIYTHLKDGLRVPE